MMVTAAPRSASSVPSTTAEVDLPAPPLELANEMVGIWPIRRVVSYKICLFVVSLSTVGYRMAVGQLLANCRRLRCWSQKPRPRVSLEQVGAADVAAQRVEGFVAR